MPYVNPFKPTAGMTPPNLVGRENVLEDFLDGLREGPGAPGRLMRITGPRGAGKTVLLTELGNIAREHGWTVVDVTGHEPLCTSIQRRIEASGPSIRSASLTARAPFVQGEVELSARPADFRSAFECTVERLTAQGNGLLVTVDEVQDASHDEMRVLASNVQYMIRAQQNIALVFAGLTTGVLDLLNGEALTFLRRAQSEELGNIPVDEVASSFAMTFERTGLLLTGAELERVAAATGGYAYLIQLVGYHVWRMANHHIVRSAVVGTEDVEQGITQAFRAFNTAVHETAIAHLTKPAIDYLFAMAEDDGVSSTAEIARRMGKTAAYASPYRRMLIERQVIESTAPGYVTFSIPYMREFLREHKHEIRARYGA